MTTITTTKQTPILLQIFALRCSSTLFKSKINPRTKQRIACSTLKILFYQNNEQLSVELYGTGPKMAM